MDAPPTNANALALYLAHLDTMQIDPSGLTVDTRGSLAVRGAGRRLAGRASRLPRIVVDGGEGAPPSAPELRIESLVGAGGMGEVYAALQVPLMRRVAVKRPLGRGVPKERARLLGEALTIGALEHPNIIPVHTLGLDGADEPLMVMKYVEGRPWSERIAPLFPESAARSQDTVDEQLRVLTQVCNAVHFAHSRGVVHRDIKPDNVMLGRFGEVYLLDWGIAVAVGPDAPGALARTQTTNDIAGTPAYMAPEMAAGADAHIDGRTDVYLLGAVLHELITGRPPHAAKTILEALASAFAARPPELGPDVPRELAEICTRALSFDPEDRFATAEALRDALLAFLRHRVSDRMTAEAVSRLDELERVLAAPAATEGHEVAVHELAAEARFGVRQALREWPDSPDAASVHVELVETLVGWHLSRGDPVTAAALLRELPNPPASLARDIEEHIERARERERAGARELTALRQIAIDADTALHTPYRGRNFILLGLGVVVSAAILGALRVTTGRDGHLEHALVAVVFTIAILMGYRRIPSDVNRTTRRLQLSLAVGSGGMAAVFGLGALSNADVTTSLSLSMLVWAIVAVMLSVFTLRRLAWICLPMAAGAVGVALAPAYRGVSVALGFSVAFVLGRHIWLHHRDE